MSDEGFYLRTDSNDPTDGPSSGASGEVGTAKYTHTGAQNVIAVTLCATLLIATTGIIGLMAMKVNVSKEVSMAVAVQWGALLAVYAKGVKK